MLLNKSDGYNKESNKGNTIETEPKKAGVRNELETVLGDPTLSDVPLVVTEGRTAHVTFSQLSFTLFRRLTRDEKPSSHFIYIKSIKVADEQLDNKRVGPAAIKKEEEECSRVYISRPSTSLYVFQYLW